MKCHRCGLPVPGLEFDRGDCVLVCVDCVRRLQLMEGKLKLIAKATQLLVDVLVGPPGEHGNNPAGVVMPNAMGGPTA